MNRKIMFLLVTSIVLFISIGAISAGNITDTTSSDTVNTKLADSNPNTNTMESGTVSNDNKKTIKTASKTSQSKSIKSSATQVKNYKQLENTIKNSKNKQVTINLADNLKISGKTMNITGSNTRVIIDGKGHTIDGAADDEDSYYDESPNHFITVQNKNTLTLKNINFKNFSGTMGSVVTNYGTLNVNNVTFNDNTGSSGGAIYSQNTLNIQNSKFNKNMAVFGGAICTSGKTSITNTQFTQNTGEIDGGAIYIQSNGKSTSATTINNCIFTKNGGQEFIYSSAIYNEDSSTKIIKSKFIQNNAEAAIYNTWNTRDSTLTIQDSLFNSTNTKPVYTEKNGKHKATTKQSNTKIITTKIPTHLTMTITRNQEFNTQIRVTGEDNNYNELTGNIVIYDNSKKISTKQLQDGETTVTLNLKSGTHRLTALYNANGKYQKSTATKTIKVNPSNKKKNTQLTITTPKHTTLNTQVQVTVKDTNKQLAKTGQVQVLEYNKVIAKANLKNGKTTIKLNLKAGNHKVRIKYLTNSQYNPSTKLITVNVDKVSTTMTTSIQSHTTTNTQIQVTVKDANKQAVKKGTVQVLSNGKQIAKANLKNGKTTIKLKLNSGNQKITIKYQANDLYKQSQNTKTVNVQKPVDSRIKTITCTNFRNDGVGTGIMVNKYDTLWISYHKGYSPQQMGSNVVICELMDPVYAKITKGIVYYKQNGKSYSKTINNIYEFGSRYTYLKNGQTPYKITVSYIPYYYK